MTISPLNLNRMKKYTPNRIDNFHATRILTDDDTNGDRFMNFVDCLQENEIRQIGNRFTPMNVFLAVLTP